MAFDDDEKLSANSLGSSKGLVTLKEPRYSREDAALTADEVTVVLELKATSTTAVREGLDLVAVLDVSRDMQAAKVAGMKKAMQFVIMKLTPIDRLSVVAFSDSATRHCPLRSVTQLAKGDLRAIVESLVVGGGANIEAGMDTALAVIAGRSTTRARAANIFLMSDGRQNYNTDARRCDPGKVAVYTFGFGKDADYRLLSDVAGNSPGGTYNWVPDGQNFSVPIAQLLGGLLTVVAQDVQLTLKPNTYDPWHPRLSVALETNYTQTTDRDTGVITIMFGALFSGEVRKVTVIHDDCEYDAQLSYTAQGDVQYQTPYNIFIRRATSQYDEQILATGSKPPLPLQYLKHITNNFCDDRILGKGGFGVVYKGVLQNGKMVAVKKLLNAMPSSQKQFENEVNLLMTLEHQNVVRLVGYCYETQHLHTFHEGKPVFAWNTESLLCLECLPNGSLDKYISGASTGLDWHTRYKIIEGISYGLQYLHEHSEPIIHLDLKPANILLDVNMEPKITDFGLSRLVDQTQTIHTAIASGTLGYMPPEFLRGIITPMSDIFSLGVIIMEVITGHREYPYDIRKSSEEFIRHELQNWRNRVQEKPGYTSLETDCQQIERCIQIGLICVNPERAKRPKMKKIINMLQGLESINWYITNEVMSSAAHMCRITSGYFVAGDAFTIFPSIP